MKLNNKGFAVSVILYSITSILVLVLFLILGLSSVNNRNKVGMSNSIKEELSGVNIVFDYEATKTNTKTETGYGCGGANREYWENDGTQYSGYITCSDGKRCLAYRATNVSPAYDYYSLTLTGVYYTCPYCFCDHEPYTNYVCESNETKVGDYCYSCPNGGTLDTTSLMCVY